MGTFINEEDPNATHLEQYEPQTTGGFLGHTAGVLQSINPETAFLAAGKLLHSTAMTGAWIGNAIIGADELKAQGLPTIDHTADYWAAIESLNERATDSYTRGVADFGAFAAATYSAVSKIKAMTGFHQAASGSKIWNVAKESLYTGVAGGIVDLTLTRAEDQRFSEYLADAGVMPDWLSWMYDRNEESEFEGRVKNAIEGFVFGLGIDSGIEIFRALKSSRSMIHKISKTPQEVRDNIKTMVGDPDVEEQIHNFYRDQNPSGALIANDELPSSGPDILFSEKEIFQKTKKKRQAKKEKKKNLEKRVEQERIFGLLRENKARKDVKEANRQIMEDRAASGDVDDPEVAEYLKDKERWLNKSVAHMPLHTNLPKINPPEEVPSTTTVGMQELDEYGLPKRTFDPKSLDEIDKSESAVKLRAQLKHMFEHDSSALRMADHIMVDPKATPEFKAKAKIVKDFYKENGIQLMNHKLHGDYTAAGTLDTFKGLALFREIDMAENLIKSRSHLELLSDTIRDIQSGAVFKSPEIWEQLKKDGFGDMHGLVRYAVAFAKTAEEAAKVITGLIANRADMVDEFTRSAQQMAKKMTKDMDFSKSLEFATMLDKYAAVDGVDSATDGVASSLGRLFGIFRHQSGSHVEQFKKDLKFARETREEAVRTGKTIEEVEAAKIAESDQVAKSGAVRMQYAINNKERKLIERFVRLGAEGKLKTPADFRAAMEVPDFADVFLTMVKGNLLSGVSTITKSVTANNAVMVGWVNVGQPLVDSMWNALHRRTRFGDSGHRAAQSFIGGASLMRNSMKALQNIIKHRGFQELSQVLTTSTGTAREGADTAIALAKKKEIIETVEIIQEQYMLEDAYVKSTMLTLAKPLIVNSLAFTNMFIRGIKNVDEVSKGLAMEGSLDRSVDEMWYRDGASEYFGKNPVTKEVFTERAGKLQREAYRIINDGRLGPLERDAQVKALFGDAHKLRDSILDTLSDAEASAKDVTVQTDVEDIKGLVGAFGSQLNHLKEMSSKSTSGKLLFGNIFYFTKTPVVFLKLVQDYSIFALSAKESRRKMLKGTAKERMEVLGKMTTGLGLFSVGATIAASGRLSGTHAPGERERMKTLGIPESSIYIGDTWYDHSALGPFSVLLDSITNWTKYLETDSEQGLLGLGAQMMNVMNQQGHVATVRDLMDLIVSDDPTLSKISRFTIDRSINAITPAKGFVLGTGGWIDNGVYRTTADKELKDLGNVMNYHLQNGLKNNIIWRKGTNALGLGLYEADYDLTGGDLFRSGDSMADRTLHLLGFGTHTAQNDQWRIHMAAYGAHAGNATGNRVFGVPLTANQYKDALRNTVLSDYDVDGVMNALVSSDVYKNAGPASRKQMLKQQFDVFLGIYKNEEFLKDPDMRNKKFILDQLKFDKMVTPRGALPGTEDFYLEARMKSGKFSVNESEDLEIIEEVFNIKGFEEDGK